MSRIQPSTTVLAAAVPRPADPRPVSATSVALWLAVAALVVIAASAFVAIRVAVREISPGSLAALRLAVAAPVVVAWAVALGRGRRRPGRRDLPLLGALGLFGAVLYNLCLNGGSRQISAASASLLVATVPVWTALLATAVGRERLRGRAWLGIGVALAGAAGVALSSSGVYGSRAGVLMVLGAAVSQAVFFVLLDRAVKRLGVLTAMAGTLAAGALLLAPRLPAAWGELALAGADARLSTLYLGLVPSVAGSLLMAFVVSRLGPSRLAIQLYLVPPTAAVLGWLLLAERLGAGTLAGGAVILAGVALVSGRRRRRPPATSTAAVDPPCATRRGECPA